MPRDYKVYLEDILESINNIQEYTSGLSFPDLKKDKKTLHAIVRNLEVVGEAMKKIPEEVRCQYPEVEWKKIAGLRDILIHEYFGIDLEIIWDIVRNKLPTLQKQILEIVRK